MIGSDSSSIQGSKIGINISGLNFYQSDIVHMDFVFFIDELDFVGWQFRDGYCAEG